MTLFADDFAVAWTDERAKLGRGGFAVVWKAQRRVDGAMFAVKVIDPASATVDAMKTAEDEIAINQMLQHPNIVEFVKAYREAKYYLVFEMVTGGELFDEIIARQHYSERDASECVQHVLSALQKVHAMGVVHRDIKPENLLLSSRSRDAVCKVTDFGLATKVGAHDQFLGFAGSPGYLAPEVIKKVPYGKAVDVWATGVILYILIIGYPPFWIGEGKTQEDMFEQIKSGNWTFPSPEWDEITAGVKDLIRQMLTVDPSKRISIDMALQHPWVTRQGSEFNTKHLHRTLTQLTKFNARRRMKAGFKAVRGAIMMRHHSSLLGAMSSKKPSSIAEEPATPTSSGGGASGKSSAEIVTAGSSSTPHPPQGSEAAAVMACNERLLQAIGNKDWDVYTQLVDSNLTCFEPEAPGMLVEGLGFHKFYFALPNAPGRKTRTSLVNPSTNFIADGVCILTYVRLMQCVGATGAPFTAKAEETRIWKRKGDSWVMAHFHRSGAASSPV